VLGELSLLSDLLPGDGLVAITSSSMRRPLPHLLSLALALVTVSSAPGADSISEERVELLFRPTVGGRRALSTDGRYFAYTEHVGPELVIVVLDLDQGKK
jgi:hypothetical protein